MASGSSQSIEDDLLFDDEGPSSSSYEPPKKTAGKGSVTTKRAHAETKTTKKTAPRVTPSNSKKAKNKITSQANASSNIIVETVPEYITDDIAPIHGSSDGSIFNKIATMSGKYAAMPADSLNWIPVSVYLKFEERFMTHAFYMQRNGLVYIDTIPPKEIDMRKVIKREQIKSFGQYISIMNFNHTDPDTDERSTKPIIFGVNESFVEREPDDYLNIYTIKCNQQTDVYAVIVTTKKKYASILMQKFIECEKNEWRVLREQSSWLDIKNPTRITRKS